MKFERNWKPRKACARFFFMSAPFKRNAIRDFDFKQLVVYDSLTDFEIAFRSISRIFARLWCTPPDEETVSLDDKLNLRTFRIRDAILRVLCIWRESFSRMPLRRLFFYIDIPQREIKSCLDRDTTVRSSFGGDLLWRLSQLTACALRVSAWTYELKCHLRTSSRGVVFESWCIRVRR